MQLNGVDINYLILVLVAGALFLATGYHFILYRQRKTRLLGCYTQYLGITFSYVMFRTIFTGFSPALYTYLNPDELIQMAAFAFYIRFMGVALQLERGRDRTPLRFVEISVRVIIGYMIINTVLANLTNYESGWSAVAYIVCKLLIRVYLLILGFFMVVKAMRYRNDTYFRYIASGAFSIIFFGIVSSVVSLGSLKFLFGLAALTWLVIGFFVDVLFFSAAVGYRIRKEYEEKEQLEVERVKLVYAAREEERNRIAKDIHDDLGSSMSSIAIYAKVAAAFVKADQEKALENLHKIEKTTTEMMEKTYETIWALQTNYDSVESVFLRISNTASEMLSAAGIDCRVQTSNPDNIKKLPYQVQKNYWLIFKEALNNCCKYSKAGFCEIVVMVTPALLTMKISDNGQGFDPSESIKGNGLANMQSRAWEIQAKLQIDSSRGRGTCIILELAQPV